MTTSETPTTKAKTPTHYAYQVNNGLDKAFWTRIGAAWAHKDGSGFTIDISCLPLDGRITLRIASEKR